MTYTIVWSDYDGCRVEEFDSEDKMLVRSNELMVKKQTGGYGTHIEAIVYGKRIELVSRDIATVWEVKR